MKSLVNELIKNADTIEFEKNPNTVSDKNFVLDVWYKDLVGTLHIALNDNDEITQVHLNFDGRKMESLNTNTNLKKLGRIFVNKYKEMKS